MKLDTITKIERYIVNALLSSPSIPLGVNIIRLADSTDEEGIVQMVNSIVVRYTDSSIDIIRQAPLDMIRTMTFEITVASQSYLTQSGHDAAIQLCAGIHETLVNRVPPNTGIEIIEPLHLASESFSGLTDSSHFTYTQRWVMKAQDYFRPIAIDPCVQRGDCSRLFPAKFLSPLKPGDVVQDGKIYVPVLPPPSQEFAYNPEYLGVELDDQGNLVYVANPAEIFLSSEEIDSGYKLVSTGIFDESGVFLICNVKDSENNQVCQYFATDSKRAILSLTLDYDQSVNVPFSELKRNSFGYINQIRTFLYVDPTNLTATKIPTTFGTLFTVELGTKLMVEGVTYVRIGNTPAGKSWVKELELTLLGEDDYIPGIQCEEEELVEGKITSC
jgi:hypothetical protein